MIEAGKNRGKLLSIVCQNRFKTPVMKMKQLLGSAKVGAIRYANAMIPSGGGGPGRKRVADAPQVMQPITST
ncbi:MAG: hypothetical protein WBI82_05740 [Sphaerochaeta sp.]